MGIVSFGKIGQAIARRAEAFGVELIAYDPYQQEAVIAAFGAKKVNKEELLSRSNIIMMQVPMTPETRHFLSGKEFAAMQQGVFIVNTGRGPDDRQRGTAQGASLRHGRRRRS